MTVQEAARLAEHYRALREDAMRIDAPWLSAIRLTGPDTRSFLQGLATQDLERTEPGRGAITFFTTERGRPIALAWVLVEADDAAWIVVDETEPGALLQHFDRFRVMEDVEFAASPRPVLVFAGPKRDPLLARQPEGVTLAAAPLSFLLNSGVDPGSPAADPAAVEAWRVGSGLPRAGIDFGPDRLVTELGEPQAISVSKGCYVGQEVVARTSHRGQVRRSRTGYRFEWAGGAEGAEVHTTDGRAAGSLTSAAPEPATGRGFGMGYLSTEPEIRESRLVLLQKGATTPVDARPWPLWT